MTDPGAALPIETPLLATLVKSHMLLGRVLKGQPELGNLNRGPMNRGLRPRLSEKIGGESTTENRAFLGKIQRGAHKRGLKPQIFRENRGEILPGKSGLFGANWRHFRAGRGLFGADRDQFLCTPQPRGKSRNCPERALFGPIGPFRAKPPFAKPPFGFPRLSGADWGLSRACRGLLEGRSGPIPLRLTATGEEQKSPRKCPFWPNWHLSGQAPVC